jgi:hypothetical protein
VSGLLAAGYNVLTNPILTDKRLARRFLRSFS